MIISDKINKVRLGIKKTISNPETSTLNKSTKEEEIVFTKYCLNDFVSARRNFSLNNKLIKCTFVTNNNTRGVGTKR